MIRSISSLFSDGMGTGGILGTLFFLAVTIFQVWMFADACRRREYVWAVFIFLFSIISAVFYYLMVYRASGGGNPLEGFEFPGAADRRRISELEANIHHLDKAHHYRQLADIYYAQGKLEKAEENYRAAFARDAADEDTRAHLGTCLAKRGKTAEALPLLEGVVTANPKHDYGYTLMTLAETQTAAGLEDRALATWRQVLGLYGYPRARVQFAQLAIKRRDYAEARARLEEVIQDAPHAAKFQQKREAVWVRRAKSLLGSLPRPREAGS